MLDRNLKKITKMKTRSYFVLITLLILSSLMIWLFNSPTPHLRSFVSKTQLHIKNINSKLKVLEPSDNRKDLEIDSTYLELLGFVNEPKLFKENKNYLEDSNEYNSNTDLKFNKINPKTPPLVTAFSSFGNKEKALLESKFKYFSNDLILIYDLDLSSSEQLKVRKTIIFQHKKKENKIIFCVLYSRSNWQTQVLLKIYRFFY